MPKRLWVRNTNIVKCLGCEDFCVPLHPRTAVHIFEHSPSSGKRRKPKWNTLGLTPCFLCRPAVSDRKVWHFDNVSMIVRQRKYDSYEFSCKPNAESSLFAEAQPRMQIWKIWKQWRNNNWQTGRAWPRRPWWFGASHSRVSWRRWACSPTWRCCPTLWSSCRRSSAST